MNNTHVYTLRRTPEGYSGPTSLYEGTRIISIAREPYPTGKADRSIPRSVGRTPNRISPPDKTALARTGDSRQINGASRKNVGAYARQGSTDGRGQIPRSYARGVGYVAGSQPKRSPAPSADDRSYGRGRSESVRSAPVSRDNRRVISKGQVNTGDFTAGVRALPRNPAHEPARLGTDRRTTVQRNGAVQDHGGINMTRGPAPAIKSAPQNKSGDHSHMRVEPASARGISQNDRGNGGYPRGQERIRRAPESHRVPNMPVDERNSRTDIRAYGDKFNRNAVYCYGNRTAADARAPKVARGNVGAKSRPSVPPPKKLTPEEQSRMKAANAARKKAEKQISAEIRKKKKTARKAVRTARKKQRRIAAKRFGVALIRAIVRAVPFIVMFFIAVSFMAGIFAVSVFAALNINPSGLPDSMKYQIGEDDSADKVTFDLSTEKYVRDRTVYMSMDDFAERFEYTAAGNSKKLKYISRMTDDVVEITIGSSAVIVNDVPLLLSSPVCSDRGEILIPLDFFSTYVTGFTVSYDEENHKVTMIREIVDYEVSVEEGRTPIYASAGFKPNTFDQLGNIAEGSLPSDILAATDPNPPTPETDELGNPIPEDGGQ